MRAATKKRRRRAHKAALVPRLPIDSPWLTAKDAAAYLRRGQRFVRSEIAAGRLRAAIVGERREILTRREWCDAWVESRVMAMPFPARSRVG